MTRPETDRKTALVTGGNRGIGRAIVVALARRGFDVALVDLQDNEDTALTRQLAEAEGVRTTFIGADIADLARHASIVQSGWDFGGPIHALVNNAGVSAAVRGDLLDVAPEDFDRVMDVNFRGTFFLTQAFARRMEADPRVAAHRSIVTVTSISAIAASPERAAYCCSKSALSMMVRLFALRLAGAGIACYELRPGIVRTAMTSGVAARYDALIGDGLVPAARWGEPDDVGRAAAALCAGEFSYMTGEALHVDGGLHVPRL